MTAKHLNQALSSVDWNSNVQEFLSQDGLVEELAECSRRLAIWALQFERIDRQNPALAFIREMQVSGHYVASLTGLALYKPAAAAMRTILETALYYTYFRSHLSELRTLSRDSSFFMLKSEIVEYHKAHTPDFVDLQNRFNLVVDLNDWYGRTSSIVHGQIPGTWVEHTSMDQIGHVEGGLPKVVDTFKEGESIVHRFFLCTAGRELWDGFTSTSKTYLLKGIPGPTKAALGLDRA